MIRPPSLPLFVTIVLGMVSPDSHVAPHKLFEWYPSPFQSHIHGREWDSLDPSIIQLNSPVQEQRSDLHLNTTLYSTPVDQASLDPFGVEGDPLAFLGPDLLFDLHGPDFRSTSSIPVQDGIPWAISDLMQSLGLVLTEEPATDSIPRVVDEVYVPASHTADARPEPSSLGQVTGASSRLVNPCALPAVDCPPLSSSFGQPTAPVLVESPSPFDIVKPASRNCTLPYRNHCFQQATQTLSRDVSDAFDSEQQWVFPETPVSFCEWRDEDGSICGEILTRASLPGHLTMHGIKNKSRDSPTKCNWVGCKRKSSLNRESIVRHIREVHLRLKRPSKRM